VQVTLTPDVKKFVEAKVRAGHYSSPADAVNALLSVAREREQMTPAEVAELRTEVGVALAELDRGEFAEYTAEDIIAEGLTARAAGRKPRLTSGRTSGWKSGPKARLKAGRAAVPHR
jgi:Arc/MetJ-type ribon-helix-helix transcriptional regulator